MTQALTDTTTDTSLDACITPPYHSQTSGTISTRSSLFFSLLPPITQSINDDIFDGTIDALDIEKVPRVKLPNTSIEYIDPALSTMPTTMQTVRSGLPATVPASTTWAGVASKSFQSSTTPPKVEAPAVDASVETDTAVPFQRQLNGNQVRKAKRQQKAGAEAGADKKIPSVTMAETDSKEVQRQKLTFPVEDQPRASNTAQGHTLGTPLSPLDSCMDNRKEVRVDKVSDAHWPTLSHSKPPIKGSKRTTVIKVPSSVGYEALAEPPTPRDSTEVENELPQAPAQVLEMVDSEPLQVDSAEVKPKTKGQKKNERRRNAKQAKKLKGEWTSVSLSLSGRSSQSWIKSLRHVVAREATP